MIEWYEQIIIQVDIIFFILLFFSERSSPTKIAVWALAFIFMPIVGLILYLFIGQSFYSERQFKLKEINDNQLEETLKAAASYSVEETNPDYKTFIDGITNLGGVGYTNNNDVKLYTLGEDKFRDLYNDLRNAKKCIHLEYYIIRDDELGNELIDILTQKVKEGLEVRLLTDDFGVGKGPMKNIKNFKRAGGQFAVFHQVLWLMFSPKKNNRNHRKIAVIDNKIGYCGGFNVGDEYLGKGPLGFWRDTAVRISGDAVMALQLRFQMDWEYATKEPLCDKKDYLKYYENDGYDTTGDCRITVASGGPDVSDFNPIRLQYLQLITNAKKSVYLHSPYFIPDDSLINALIMAAAKGVDVKVIIPDKPDHMFVFWNNIRSANIVMSKGVRVFMYNRGFVHSKTMVVDGEYCSVGSANFDDRSMVHNFETNAIILSKDIGKQMDDAFNEDLKYCTEYTQEDYNSINGYQMLKVVFSKLFGGLA
jgi:cardiolipin synthase